MPQYERTAANGATYTEHHSWHVQFRTPDGGKWELMCVETSLEAALSQVNFACAHAEFPPQTTFRATVPDADGSIITRHYLWGKWVTPAEFHKAGFTPEG